MSLPPIPCAHCGVNFMRHTIDPDWPKLCNNCWLKENKTKVRKVMNETRLLINCPREIAIRLEEYCLNTGIGMSDLLIQLIEKYFDSLTPSHIHVCCDENLDKSGKKRKKNKGED